MKKARLSLLLDVAAERVRQDDRFGVASERGYTPSQWLSVLMEEVGEVAKEVNEDGKTSLLIAELVQVAAVAVAFAEAKLAELEEA